MKKPLALILVFLLVLAGSAAVLAFQPPRDTTPPPAEETQAGGDTEQEETEEAEAPAEEEAAEEEPAEEEAAEEEPAADGAQRTVWDGVYTEAQAERGRVTAGTATCTACHGNTMRGTPGGPNLANSAFRRKWNEQSVNDLFTWMHDNMPVGRGNAFPLTDYIDILAFIFSENNFPAGETELTPDGAVLSQILIVPRPE